MENKKATKKVHLCTVGVMVGGCCRGLADGEDGIILTCSYSSLRVGF